MINTELLEKYVQLLGQDKMFGLWQGFEQETKQGLHETVAGWLAFEQSDLLRNFFHARRCGALSCGMTSFAAACAEWEDYFLSGGSAEALAEKLPDLVSLFDKEAAEVRNFLEKKHD